MSSPARPLVSTDSLRFELARAVIEQDPAARALPRFAVEPSTFSLDEAVREHTAHLGYQETTG